MAMAGEWRRTGAATRANAHGWGAVAFGAIHCQVEPAPATATAVPLESLFPKLTGRVVDTAQMLTPSAQVYLTQMLERLEQSTTDQVVVVTVPSLGGYSIEEFGLQLGRHWGIGQRTRTTESCCWWPRMIARCGSKWATAWKGGSTISGRTSLSTTRSFRISRMSCTPPGSLPAPPPSCVCWSPTARGCWRTAGGAELVPADRMDVVVQGVVLPGVRRLAPGRDTGFVNQAVPAMIRPHVNPGPSVIRDRAVHSTGSTPAVRVPAQVPIRIVSGAAVAVLAVAGHPAVGSASEKSLRTRC